MMYKQVTSIEKTSENKDFFQSLLHDYLNDDEDNIIENLLTLPKSDREPMSEADMMEQITLDKGFYKKMGNHVLSASRSVIALYEQTQDNPKPLYLTEKETNTLADALGIAVQAIHDTDTDLAKLYERVKRHKANY